MGFSFRICCHHLVGDVVGRATPDLDDLLLALALGDQAPAAEVVDLLDLQLEAGQDLALAGRRHDVVLGHGHACAVA